MLKAWGSGDRTALELLTARVYDELRRMAQRYMRSERPGNTLQTTALVNEAYLRLVGVQYLTWEHRAQFFVICAQMMRRILVDAARARGADKRGGEAIRLNVEEVANLSRGPDAALVALDQALQDLAKIAPRQAKVVELRYFGGLSVEQTVQAMGTSERTVMRDWEFAKAWLSRELSR